MNRKNKLHYELFKFENNIEMKIFIAILSHATMVYRTNKINGIQNFSLKGYLSDDSFLPRKSLTFKKLEKIINDFNSLFFDVLSCEDKQVYFKLSKEYLTTIANNNGFNKVDLYSLKEITDIRSTKLKILTQLKPSGYFDLNYMIKVLMLNKVSRRNNKIAKIKNAFDNSGVDFIYKHPNNQNAKVLDEHYKFHYKTIL
ncbi:hypothetical protein H5125_12790 [Shewanella sp. SR44-4]|uniref:hypothetical protein n=1 Tax=Shewanella sp. SR44-4 TaxID=2760935 RepID=UPI0015FED21D|nr:hypothetical protein [Shewanella sp. SR44-4]MBB1363021.1 hypothetical protein [Shewanella sp. SR44-4]